MTEEAGKASGIEKFDGTDFAYWRMQIEDYLYGRKLHLPLLGTKPEREDHNRSDEGFVRWEAMRMAVSNSTGKEKLKYNDIRDLILAEEIRRRDAGETSGSGSAQNFKTRGRGNDKNSNQGRSKSRNSNRNRSKSRSGQQVQCWNCGKTSHFRRQCKSPKKKNENDSANAVTKEVILVKVYLADGSALDVVGLGDVRISLPNEFVWLLEKVRHIPDLRRNLISVGKLDDEGHAILFVGGTWKVTKGVRVLARGKKIGTLYITSGPRDTIAVADASTDTSLWHRRLGHMNEKEMKMLLSKGKLPELKTSKVEKLELVHIDLWGPSPVASLGGSRYYITFIDDSSRKGIGMEKTIPGTPQQNGVAERMNRTLNERARSMRLHAGLPKNFWTDDVSTAAYLINQGPSVSMEFRLPEEVWSGKEVMYKDRSTVVSDVTEIDQKKFEFVNLDELTESTVQKGGEEDKENSVMMKPCKMRISSKWELVMKDEMDSLLGNQTWELTELPVGKKVLHNKWVYRIKNAHDENYHLEQLDVKTTFLHGDLEEDLYMIQPKGFIVQEQENLVCKLRKSLYDFKQAPRQWYKKFDSFMHRIGFKRCEVDHCYYFAMKDLGAAKQILGMRIIRDKANGTLKLSQLEYVKKVLNRFNRNEAKPMSTPLGSHFKLSKKQSLKTEEERDHMSKVPYASAIGSLIYAMVCTRPDIAYAVGVVSRFMSRPGKQHWEAVKWILRYLKGSLDTCLCFTGASLKLQGYVDADFAGDIDSRKSTIEFVFTLGGTVISFYYRS
ncbi:Retrovirus-related Pol polyprotein from transposon TNT 1-94 [Vitis vinifera]|uniref:Retrovirus-related Pol polyprotein from transposon TNT 1-94 n=1 Tax=Vitis vinifera TaxID=29760 RepID=A0A438DR77_VITVI|nr:Retrovirus-related Pol polyprotein from transposon TNT 1-94 [Vitis vinifera]